MTATGDANIRIVHESEADRSQLSALFDEAFGPLMRRFLTERGDWMYRGREGRIVATVDGVVAGYRAMIPGTWAFRGRQLQGIWAVNLYVRPTFRGMGLQRLLDDRVSQAADLRMSFPGKLGATIYARQGYGVREDLEEWHMHLAPIPYWRARSGSGPRLAMRRAAATARTAIQDVRSRYYRPRRTTVTDPPDLAVLEGIFHRYLDPEYVTTLRDAAFLQWRYLDSPYRSDLVFYVTGLGGQTTHYAIVRYTPSLPTSARILDLFGDFGDQAGLNDVLRTIARDAARRRASHVATLATSPDVARAVRAAGFFPVKRHRFRWSAEDAELHARFSAAKLHWTLGDSDNDLQTSAFS